jgi:hypothetical protein
MTVVLALWILGGEVIRPFAIAMAIGIVVGTYSSIFIAAPTLLFLENRFGGGTSASAPAGGGEASHSAAVRREIPVRGQHQRPGKKKRQRGKKRRG